MDPHKTAAASGLAGTPRWVWPVLSVLALVTGLVLAVDSAFASSATYDEVTYLRVAARWWRTGDQTEITRMGSPLTFWKLQQVPVLWILDPRGAANGLTTRLAMRACSYPSCAPVRSGCGWRPSC